MLLTQADAQELQKINLDIERAGLHAMGLKDDEIEKVLQAMPRDHNDKTQRDNYHAILEQARADALTRQDNKRLFFMCGGIVGAGASSVLAGLLGVAQYNKSACVMMGLMGVSLAYMALNWRMLNCSPHHEKRKIRRARAKARLKGYRALCRHQNNRDRERD